MRECPFKGHAHGLKGLGWWWQCQAHTQVGACGYLEILVLTLLQSSVTLAFEKCMLVVTILQQ